MIPDLSTPRSIHVIGAAGSGMRPITDVLVRMGHTVTGSDLDEGPTVEQLRADGVEMHIGHDPANLGSAEFVVISTAIPDDNIEVHAAGERGIPVLRRRSILPAIAAERRSIVVAGTHGKTTTSSMLATAMRESGLEPSFIIGGVVKDVGAGAVWTDGEWFVVEGDESDRTFLSLGAEIAVITNVEPDHLETYDNDPDQLMAAFVEFASGATTRIYCADDSGAMAIHAAAPGSTYGTADDADYRMVDLEHGSASVAFTLRHDDADLARVVLPTSGMHNARNAAGALVAAIAAGAAPEAAAAALAGFAGVARRFDFRGEAAGVRFVDDYAHHPTEVEATLAAAVAGGWPRIVCVFEPLRYSRTELMSRAFADAFTQADVLVITSIHPASEPPRPGVTSKMILDAVLDAHPWSNVAWIPDLDEVADWLTVNLRPGDLCLTLGGGPVTNLPDQVIPRLETRGAT
ncbi:MAG: UDP-N-acetylmuramate--L-alanine ligase [Actinomycetota bacterium]